MDKTRIAIVGANGKVGTELSLLFAQKDDKEVIPIVRNVLGSAFLKMNGLECRIADITNKADATEALKDADVVVVASYSKILGKKGDEVNESIVENCIRCSPKSSRIVYFSSIRAFSRKIDQSVTPISFLDQYGHRKRSLETLLLRVCAEEGKLGYALRLGHVLGPHQTRVKLIGELLSEKKNVSIAVHKDRPSNVVHTVTIMNAIEVCSRDRIRPGVFTLVNSPQWTWGDVFDHYGKGSLDIVYDPHSPSGHREWFGGLKKAGMKLAEGKVELLIALRSYIPKSLDRNLYARYKVRKFGKELDEFERKDGPIRLRGFDYEVAPGPFIPGLEATRKILVSEYSLQPIFRDNARD